MAFILFWAAAPKGTKGITWVYGPPIFGQYQSLSTITNLTLTLTLIFSLIPIWNQLNPNPNFLPNPYLKLIQP